jgi:hypothetical protein
MIMGLSVCISCGSGESDRVRGRGLESARLTVAEQARVYAATVRAAFDVGPSLTLLIHPELLPTSRGYAGGDVMPKAVKQAMLEAGTIQGDCRPDRTAERRAPVCDAKSPGYVVHLSDVFRVPGDSLQVYLMAERYDTRSSGKSSPFRFESAFQLIRRSDGWKVARKARLRTT